MELSRKLAPFRGVLIFLILTATCLFPFAAPAADGEAAQDSASPVTLTGDFKSAIVIDAETGLVLVAANENKRRQPASMLKMMTELLVLEHVAEGDLNLEDKVKVSAKASNMGGSQVYLKHGEVFTVEELLHALAIHSANDAAVALAGDGSRNCSTSTASLSARNASLIPNATSMLSSRS